MFGINGIFSFFARSRQEFHSVLMEFVPSDDLARDGEKYKYVKIAGITESFSTKHARELEIIIDFACQEMDDHLAGAVNAFVAKLMRAINN